MRASRASGSKLALPTLNDGGRSPGSSRCVVCFFSKSDPRYDIFRL